MTKETTAPRRPRRRAITALAAGIAAATALTLAPMAPASAAVQAPQNVLGIVTSPTAATIQWSAPNGGDEPTYYIVNVDNPLTPLFPDHQAFTAATGRSYGFANLVPNTTYDIWVAANDGVTEVAASGPDITTPLATPTTPPPAAPPYAPFYSVDAFIKQNYQDWLDRAPRFDELQYWRTALNNGLTVTDFLEDGCSVLTCTVPPATPGGMRLNPYVDGVEKQVIRLYVAYYLRNPEFAGFDYWRDVRRANQRSLRGVADFMSRSPEFRKMYGSLDNAEFVSLVYRNVLGRQAEAAGFTYWTRQLETGSISRGELMLGFSTSPEFDGKTFASTVATEIYGDMLDRSPTPAEYDLATRIVPADLADSLYKTIMSGLEYQNRVRGGSAS